MRKNKLNQFSLKVTGCILGLLSAGISTAMAAQDFDVYYKPSNFKRVCHANNLTFNTASKTLTVNGFTGVDNCSPMSETSAAQLDKLVATDTNILVAAPFNLQLLDYSGLINKSGEVTGEAGKNVQVVLTDLPAVQPPPTNNNGFVNTACLTTDNTLASLFQCDSNVYITNPNQFNATHLPGCAGKESTDPNSCRYSGSFTNETYAIRLDFKGYSEQFNKSAYPYTPVRLITLDDMAGVDAKYKLFVMAISEKPGDFLDYLPNKQNCSHIDAAGSITINVSQSGNGSNLNDLCPLTSGKLYYINVRPLNSSCKPSASDPSVNCRVEINANFPVSAPTTFIAPKSVRARKYN